ncbi:MAG: OsmC family protein [Cyclobacteriaceae bacterium]
MKMVTRMLGDEIFESFNDQNNPVTIDMRPREQKKGQSPVELVLSALAGCGAVDIVAILKKRRKTLTDFVIETEGTRRDETPRFFTAFHCHYIITSPDVTEDELQKAAALSLEKYCSVAHSLKAAVTFSVQVVRPQSE